MNRKNALKCAILAFGFLLFTTILGYILGAERGAIVFFLLCSAVVVCLWFFSDNLILRVFRAVHAGEKQLALENLLLDISLKSDMQVPGLYLTPDLTPNVFSLGRSKREGKIVLTTGLLNTLNRFELESVLACELYHIKSGDSFANSFLGALLFIILLPSVVFRWLAYFMIGAEVSPSSPNHKIIKLRPSKLLSLLASGYYALNMPLIHMIYSFVLDKDRMDKAKLESKKICENKMAIESAIIKIKNADYFLPMEMIPGMNHLHFKVDQSRFGFYDL